MKRIICALVLLLCVVHHEAKRVDVKTSKERPLNRHFSKQSQSHAQEPDTISHAASESSFVGAPPQNGNVRKDYVSFLSGLMGSLFSVGDENVHQSAPSADAQSPKTALTPYYFSLPSAIPNQDQEALKQVSLPDPSEPGPGDCQKQESEEIELRRILRHVEEELESKKDLIDTLTKNQVNTCLHVFSNIILLIIFWYY